MTCDKIYVPNFTPEQIKECHQCKHASGKKVWCCLFGVYIRQVVHSTFPGIDPKDIIYPAHKKNPILFPKRVPPKSLIEDKRFPSKIAMARSMVWNSIKYVKAGRPKRTIRRQKAIIIICKSCEHYIEEVMLGPRCRICGCCLDIKKRWATANCPLPKPKW